MSVVSLNRFFFHVSEGDLEVHDKMLCAAFLLVRETFLPLQAVLCLSLLLSLETYFSP